MMRDPSLRTQMRDVMALEACRAMPRKTEKFLVVTEANAWFDLDEIAEMGAGVVGMGSCN
ncbi:uncharacterized protein ColSpa_02320 [Colletotrichum spaethianum]|uniref:Uncharacterized protein n=1 Tax=Colletotrichum spaethianum TaxID=700344 RepID=A0AA37P755_9PEZI|nr:uncharacterized protein ColSpa_02320 [Colletotrichum spaethianum]GKT42139.1 hypothetical protein ColSpa_02320 [Colletotrichum spaethianum]